MLVKEQPDARIQRLMTDYRQAVDDAIDLLRQSGISGPVAAMLSPVWRLPQYGQLCDGTQYFRHGAGIEVYLETGAVDFNFHDVAAGNLDMGFVARFGRATCDRYGYSSIKELEADLIRFENHGNA